MILCLCCCVHLVSNQVIPETVMKYGMLSLIRGKRTLITPVILSMFVVDYKELNNVTLHLLFQLIDP
jgi:hypothetical protein